MTNGKILRRDWPTALPQQHGNQEELHAAEEDLQPEAEIENLKKVFAAAKEPRRSEVITVRLRNFRSEKYILVQDLIVSLERIDDQFLACSYDTDQYGHGFCPEDAIGHLCSVLEDYYDLLQEEEANLSAPLGAHLRYLNSILREAR